MSYVAETLAPGEKILARATFNWTYSLESFFWAILGAAPIVYAFYIIGLEGADLGDPRWIYGLSGVPAVLGVMLLLGHLVHLQTTEIVVTSSRFVFKTGLVSRASKEVSLNKIEEINLDQSILGRIFGYGHLTLRGTGVGVIMLPDVDNPVKLRRVIEGAKAALRDERDDTAFDLDADPEMPSPVSDEAPAGDVPAFAARQPDGDAEQTLAKSTRKRLGLRTLLRRGANDSDAGRPSPPADLR